MLDERQLRACYLLAQGNSKASVSREVGVNVKTITAWLKKEEFNAEVDKCLELQKLSIEQTIERNVEPIMRRMLGIALKSDSEKTSLDACIYLVNRLLGTPTAKTQEVTEDTNNQEENVEDILKEIEENKVIQLKKAK